jgi:hypothetical protein
MEKEQIIKALGEEIKLADYVGNGVKTTLFKNTIALIKELTEECENYKSIAEYQQSCNMDRGFKIKRLTEENERLQKAKYIYATVDYCADDLAKALEENERLKAEVSVKKKLLKRCSGLVETIQANTVREFAERLKYTLCINNEENTEFFDYSYTLETIDEVANKILNNTEEEKK